MPYMVRGRVHVMHAAYLSRPKKENRGVSLGNPHHRDAV